MLRKVKKRLKEPSTWLGISLLAAVLGVPNEQISQFNQIVAAVGSILGIALPESNS